MIHYHGTPISPHDKMLELAGRNFCVSFATHTRGKDTIEQAHAIGQSVMLDNGAFSLWRSGRGTDWTGYYDWAEPWLDHPTTWAVIPDVIDGSEQDNDLLLVKWSQRRLPRGAPVWHLNESLDRLRRLCHGYPRVCLGSSGQYATVGSSSWHRRMEQANEHPAPGPRPRPAVAAGPDPVHRATRPHPVRLRRPHRLAERRRHPARLHRGHRPPRHHHRPHRIRSPTMTPKPKKPAKPGPVDEPLESRDDRDKNQDQDQPEPEQRNWHGEPTDELKIVVKQDVIEIDLPRDGNEADVLERIANLVAELG